MNEYVYLAGDSITRHQARGMFCDFTNRNSGDYVDSADSVVAVLFGAANLNYILDGSKFPGVQGLRFYFVLSTREDGTRYRNLLAVPIDEKGANLVPFLTTSGSDNAKRAVLNFALICPAHCGQSTAVECL